jgi:hypothetical protein
MPSCSGRCVPRIFQEKLLRYRRSRCGVFGPAPTTVYASTLQMDVTRTRTIVDSAESR